MDEQEIIESNVPMLKYQLRTTVMNGRTLAEAYGMIRQFIELGDAAFPRLRDLKLVALDSARAQLEQEFNANIQYMQRASLRCGRPDWYAGPDAQAQVWPALVRRLKEQNRTDLEIEGVDRDSTAVVSLLSNPGLPAFKDRGLVIGHVQSGKTGNMAAVIAKAADTPYKFFVVLSGMTDVLRQQTQKRLNDDIINNGNPDGWHAWTGIESDFNHPATGGFPLGGTQRHIAVIKKNAGILRRFIRKLRQTPRRQLEDTPFLIIDDECDQASVNANGLEKRVTAINKLIRILIGELPRVTYVGYTATPFANVLIDPRTDNRELGLDLYPKDFIHALGRPKAYFGAVELFGREALEGESTEDSGEYESGYDMIRIVPDADSERMRPGAGGQGDPFVFQVTGSLDTAIKYFILAASARCARGQQDRHSTMLVHTSMLNVIHQATRDAVSAYVTELLGRIRAGDPRLLAELEQLWADESLRVPSGLFGNAPVGFGDLSPHLQATIEAVEVKVENYLSQDRIDYSQPGRKYIVIGGNVLARGLTLEGLMVSYFLRTASQYDTLMQMGRWFGYRPGFEEFPRVWMERWVRDAFFELATVEEEMRRFTRRYAEENLTPEQFALPIRLIAGLSPTAAGKMRNADHIRVGYEGEHPQTVNFRRYDQAWLDAAWKAGSSLMGVQGGVDNLRGNMVRYGVDAAEVVSFLNSYPVIDTGTMRRGTILRYIQELNRRQKLTTWNVVVIGSGQGRPSRLPLGNAGNVPCVTRNPLRDSGEIANIKALMSRQDLFADLAEVPAGAGDMSWDGIKKYRKDNRMPPMLILYPISADSNPSQRSALSREPMQAVMDVLGIGIVFPGTPGSGVDYIQAAIPPLDAEVDPLPEEEAMGDADNTALDDEVINANA